MEEGGRADEVGTRPEGDAAHRLGVFEFVDRGEMAIGQRRVRQRPEALGWLQLWRTRIGILHPGSPLLLAISSFGEVRKKKKKREKTCRLQVDVRKGKSTNGYESNYKRTIH